MSSPNLGIPHVAASQNQKEVTLNDALDALDRAGNETADLDVSTGNTLAPASVWRRAFLLRLTGLPAADLAVTVPDGQRVAAIHNTTGRSVTLRTASLGATVILGPGSLAIVAARGADLQALASSSSGGLYDLGLFLAGPPAAGALLFQFVFPRAVTFPAGLAGTTAAAATPATGAASVTLRRNGVAVGSITFAAGAATPAFTLPSPVGFAPGDRLELLAPSPADPTLADVSLCLVGTRS